MELDKRIKEGKRPLTCLDIEQARQFVGKECIFSDIFANFKDINQYLFVDSDYTAILSIDERASCGDYVFKNSKNNLRYSLILPLEWVKEPEKKYRPFTLNEFLVTFPMLTDITMREKGDNDCIITCTVTAYRTRIMSADICLGVEWISLKELFDKYEYKNTLGDWIPFGEEIEE